MKSITIKVMLIAATLGAAIFALAGSADASHVKMDIVAPSQATVGNSVHVRAMLRSADNGLPVAGAPVTFYMDATFGGVSGEVELGKAVTDQNGVAVLNYQPRSAGEHRIRVEYLTPGASEPEEATWTHSVVGSSQLYRSTAGIQVPGLNVWLLIAGVTAVWAILFSVALRVIAIARAGRDAESASASEPAPRPGHAARPPLASKSGASGAR